MIYLKLFLKDAEVKQWIEAEDIKVSSILMILKKSLGYKNQTEIIRKTNLDPSFLRIKLCWKTDQEQEYADLLCVLNGIVEYFISTSALGKRFYYRGRTLLNYVAENGSLIFTPYYKAFEEEGTKSLMFWTIEKNNRKMDKRKILIVYHRADYDGIFSAIITKKYYESKGVRVETQGWNYGDDLIDIHAKIPVYQGVVMVDVCLPTPQMIELKESGRLTWIDHHETAITESKENGFDRVPGKREIGIAACELTWKYFNPAKETPTLISYAGAYDVWNKEKYNWEEEVIPLQYGLKDEYGLSLKKLETDWDDLLEDNEWIMDKGLVIYEWIQHISEAWVQNCGFEVQVGEQALKGIAIVTPMTGSLVFESVLQKYDLFLVVQVRDNASRISVSMYTEPDKDLGGFSCGTYLKEKYGGGGHTCSAGCNNIDQETFRRLIYEHKF